MMTVRFSTGFSIQYNDANYMERCQDAGGSYCRLLTAKDGNIIARVPVEALIEWRQPCVTTDARGLTIDKAVDYLANHTGELRRASSWNLKQLKIALQEFNAKTCCWREA